ncbi:S locus-related glycoprotein 1 binding pollen coat protein [Arabidopsis thaliana x Arabidopsis arenosa]|uniref:Putative defensin-like protein 139 n=5 Tax=Arabidopsis TaxID=3701 RepID=DF139_ARATH|nr:RecName: Full=Putative defensin-like protein 139; AltName: Full=Putative low-molecular-weight cysteine-rich protein 7; Short=Protein LCR7; Flags: Precursor [Arabidopsis thaliana]KAG7616555.1 S locus-related glycoprotein 1 binding pollen coat protein [Arabidopsis thaliana x Arabidopsis arenosa]KAG7621027.1 S locus-related glycoprotein 1 binding pollen coat protein [Arabidopsis suecica]OAO99154.1 LCR7 [Arabidopsis thaliana]
MEPSNQIFFYLRRSKLLSGLGEIRMAKGQPLGTMERCYDMLTWGECVPDNCAFSCALKRHGKGGCIKAYDNRPACVCYYTCLRS